MELNVVTNTVNFSGIEIRLRTVEAIRCNMVGTLPATDNLDAVKQLFQGLNQLQECYSSYDKYGCAGTHAKALWNAFVAKHGLVVLRQSLEYPRDDKPFYAVTHWVKEISKWVGRLASGQKDRVLDVDLICFLLTWYQFLAYERYEQQPHRALTHT